MSANVFLARHGSHAELGHVLSGRSEIVLSEKGIGEARALALLCRSLGVGSVQSSPRTRATQTAGTVAELLGLGVELVDDLDEIDFGAWTGQSFVDLGDDDRWHRWNSHRSSVSPPGGESMVEATRRIQRHVEQLAAAGRTNVLCVTHCDLIRGAIASYTGAGIDQLLSFDVEPASLSSLAIEGGTVRVTSVNQVAS